MSPIRENQQLRQPPLPKPAEDDMASEYFENLQGIDNIARFCDIDHDRHELVDNATALLGANGGGDNFAILDLTPASPALNPANVETSSLRQNTALYNWSVLQSTGFGSTSLQSLDNNDLGIEAGHDLVTVVDSLAFPMEVNPYNNIVDITWTGFNVDAVQPVGYGPPLTLETNPLPAPINTHGVAPNSPDGKHACLCGKIFARTDSRRRHILSASNRATQSIAQATGTPGPAGRYPCMLCNDYANISNRRDHLRQHLGENGVHKMNKEGIEWYFRTYH